MSHTSKAVLASTAIYPPPTYYKLQTHSGHTIESKKIGNEVLMRVLPDYQLTPREAYNLHSNSMTSMVCLPALIKRNTLGACRCSLAVPAILSTCKLIYPDQLAPTPSCMIHTVSRPIRPSVKPENTPPSSTNAMIKAMYHQKRVVPKPTCTCGSLCTCLSSWSEQPCLTRNH
jgi:hypothetical protein